MTFASAPQHSEGHSWAAHSASNKSVLCSLPGAQPPERTHLLNTCKQLEVSQQCCVPVRANPRQLRIQGNGEQQRRMHPRPTQLAALALAVVTSVLYKGQMLCPSHWLHVTGALQHTSSQLWSRPHVVCGDMSLRSWLPHPPASQYATQVWGLQHSCRHSKVLSHGLLCASGICNTKTVEQTHNHTHRHF